MECIHVWIDCLPKRVGIVIDVGAGDTEIHYIEDEEHNTNWEHVEILPTDIATGVGESHVC